MFVSPQDMCSVYKWNVKYDLDCCHNPSHFKFEPLTKIICQDMYVWARQVAQDAYISDRLRNVNICVTVVFVYLYF